MAKIAIVGLGYVGLTSLVAFAELGHSVIGIDLNEGRVSSLLEGTVPFFEPGLQQRFNLHNAGKNLTLNSNFEEIDTEVQFAFICVPTPSDTTGKTDLSFVESAIASLAPALVPGAIIVIKSTVPIGTSKKIQSKLSESGLRVCSNPEFLSEGNALEDFLAPNRIVIGADDEKTALEVLSLYKGITAPHVLCGLSTAESIKYASNSFLALKLSFVNELANLCQAAGSDFGEVARGMALDQRIGPHFLNPGPGWGGSCFPKDTSELVKSAGELGVPMATVEAAISSNKTTMNRIIDLVKQSTGGDLTRMKIAIWGLAFKANTDDIRDSPSLVIANLLAEEGAEISGYDPLVKSLKSPNIKLFSDALTACSGANALLILTEWEEFQRVDPASVRERMASNPFIFDSRRVLSAQAWSKQFQNFSVIGQ